MVMAVMEVQPIVLGVLLLLLDKILVELIITLAVAVRVEITQALADLAVVASAARHQLITVALELPILEAVAEVQVMHLEQALVAMAVQEL
jgi:hypothetical protein